MNDWIDIKQYGPPEHTLPVLVSGGVACYRDGVWYTGMEEPMFQRPIQWEVTHYAELEVL